MDRIITQQATNSILSDHLRDPEFQKTVKECWASSIPCQTENFELIAEPFRVCRIFNFLKEQDLQDLKDEVQELPFERTAMDLFQFEQSEDFKSIEKEGNIKKFRDTFLTEMKEWMQNQTGIELNDTLSMSSSMYFKGDYLLCHDDNNDDRRIAFILYLNNYWSEQNGGDLALFDTDEYMQPKDIVKRISPKHNCLLFFEVTHNSYHQVLELMTTEKYRWTINGWFHGPLPNNRLIKPKRPDPVITFESLWFDSTFIDYWVQKFYINRKLGTEIYDEFRRCSISLLANFFRINQYNALNDSIRDESIEWVRVGPPDVRNYEVAKLETLPHVLRNFFKFLKSREFITLINWFTNIDVVPQGEDESNHPSVSIEIQRWSKGSYSLIDPAETDKQSLELLLVESSSDDDDDDVDEVDDVDDDNLANQSSDEMVYVDNIVVEKTSSDDDIRFNNVVKKKAENSLKDDDDNNDLCLYDDDKPNYNVQYDLNTDSSDDQNPDYDVVDNNIRTDDPAVNHYVINGNNRENNVDDVVDNNINDANDESDNDDVVDNNVNNANSENDDGDVVDNNVNVANHENDDADVVVNNVNVANYENIDHVQGPEDIIDLGLNSVNIARNPIEVVVEKSSESSSEEIPTPSKKLKLSSHILNKIYNEGKAEKSFDAPSTSNHETGEASSEEEEEEEEECEDTFKDPLVKSEATIQVEQEIKIYETAMWMIENKKVVLPLKESFRDLVKDRMEFYKFVENYRFDMEDTKAPRDDKGKHYFAGESCNIVRENQKIIIKHFKEFKKKTDPVIDTILEIYRKIESEQYVSADEDPDYEIISADPYETIVKKENEIARDKRHHIEIERLKLPNRGLEVIIPFNPLMNKEDEQVLYYVDPFCDDAEKAVLDRVPLKYNHIAVVDKQRHISRVHKYVSQTVSHEFYLIMVTMYKKRYNVSKIMTYLEEYRAKEARGQNN